MLPTWIVMLAMASQAPAPPTASIAAGVPLRVVLETRVRVKRVGQPIQGALLEPVYVYDRMVLPAQSRVEGHVSAIGGVPAGRRFRAILSGNLTPARELRAQFDTVVLSDGSRLPLATLPSRGARVTLVAKPAKQDRFAGMAPAAVRALKAPGKMSRLKDALLERLPYHRQAWRAGTVFQNAGLQSPLTAPAAALAMAPPENQQVSARLLTALTSRNARRGMPVEAVVTRPQFSADHTLLIPEGARLHGEVVEAKRARRFHRNGKLQFVFRRIELPAAAPANVQGYVEQVQTDYTSHLAVDAEGSIRANSPKSRFLFPALAVAAAGLSLHQDYNSEGVPDQDIGGRAESGAVGLGAIGTVLAQASHTLASGMAFAGAGFSIYLNFIARGQDVVLPANMPVEVSLRPSRTQSTAGSAAPR